MTNEETALISKRFEELWPKADKWDIRLVGKATRNQSFEAVCAALDRLRSGENNRFTPSADKVASVAREIHIEANKAANQEQEGCSYCMGSGGQEAVLYILPIAEKGKFDPADFIAGAKTILILPEVARNHSVKWCTKFYPCPRCWRGDRRLRFMDHLVKIRGFYEEWRAFCREQTKRNLEAKAEQVQRGTEGGA